MIVIDFSAHAEALRYCVTVNRGQPVEWPVAYTTVMDVIQDAAIGRYYAFRQLCLWYHRLPLPATPAQRLITDLVVERYKQYKPNYQEGGRYAEHHLKTGTRLKWATRGDHKVCIHASDTGVTSNV